MNAAKRNSRPFQSSHIKLYQSKKSPRDIEGPSLLFFYEVFIFIGVSHEVMDNSCDHCSKKNVFISRGYNRAWTCHGSFLENVHFPQYEKGSLKLNTWQLDNV